MALDRAKLAIGRGVSVWVLEAPDGFGEAQFHAHHALQITACLSGTLRLIGETSDVSGPVIAVAADALHRFEAQGLLVFIFVEPESQSGRSLHHALFASGTLARLAETTILPIAAPLARTFENDLPPSRLMQAGWDVVEALAPRATPPPNDDRMARVIEHVSVHLDPSLETAAEAVGVHLSPSRLRHLFVEQTGLAHKTYLLWSRLVRALEVYADGRSLTEAAHAAGFADSAHLSRTFKRTFGLPATTLERL